MLSIAPGRSLIGVGLQDPLGDGKMGTVISFPDMGRRARRIRLRVRNQESATVIILPVIRIERFIEEPREASRSQRRRRRRRVSRT